MQEIRSLIELVKLPQVRVESHKSTSAIYRAIREGTFPAPVKIGPRSVAWTRSSLEEWKRGCIEASQKA